jgi:cyclopropane fatty-acyl-phospholipid synthase-like methyltransferase
MTLSRKDSVRISSILIEKEIFSGGGYDDFHEAGENQLIVLTHFGLEPSSKVLDIGCGCLRGGRWLIPSLNSKCYFGLEPNIEMLEVGKNIVVDSETMDEKKPVFDSNSDFDFAVFDTTFDYVIARSIWTHSSKKQIEKMLDQFVRNSSDSAKFLTSYMKPRIPIFDDYKGDHWIGKSHESNQPGITRHSFKWIEKTCNNRGLSVTNVDSDLNYRAQIWLLIEKK